MNPANIKADVCRELSLDEQEIAFDFIRYLQANHMEFVKDSCDYWKDKRYYWVHLHNKCVCFIAIKNPDEKENHWTVWSGDIDSAWLEIPSADDRLKETAWKHLDHCGHCGSCGGGRHKIVFGKEFHDICGCTFRVDNPASEDLPFLQWMVDVKKREIQNAQR